MERWPEHPPYEGAYGDIVPHLTLVQGREPEGLVRLIEETLPRVALASEAWLMVEGVTRRGACIRDAP